MAGVQDSNGVVRDETSRQCTASTPTQGNTTVPPWCRKPQREPNRCELTDEGHYQDSIATLEVDPSHMVDQPTEAWTEQDAKVVALKASAVHDLLR